MVFVLVNSDLNDLILGSKALDRSDENRCLKLGTLVLEAPGSGGFFINNNGYQ